MGFPVSFIDLRKGEARLVLQAGSAFFCLIAAHTMMETTRDALFLGKLPPSRLTFVYALLAGLAFVASPWSRRFADNYGRRNALVFGLMAASFGTTVIYLMPKTAAVVFGLYIWSGLIGAVLVSQFWLLAGQLFNVSQGKRLFGPLAAGGALGAVVGASGAATALLFVDVEALLLAAAGFLLIAATVLTAVPAADETPPVLGVKVAAPPGDRRSLLKQYPYLGYMAALVVLGTAATVTTDYLFKSVTAAAFAPDELGPFFARYYAVLNAIGLFIQLGVAAALVKRLGVIAALGVLPLLLLIGGLGAVVAGGTLWIVLATKGADGGLRHSLNRVASELIWMPLPSKVRADAKYTFDTVLGRLVQAAMAAAILALASFGLDTPRILAGIVAVLAFGWVASATLLRRPYLDLFRASLGHGALELDEVELDINSVEVAIDALASTEDAKVLSAIDLLVANGRAGLISSLILYHQSEPVLLRALEAIPDGKRLGWLPLTARLLTHESEAVRIAAMRAVSLAPWETARLHLEARAYDVSPTVRAHAIFHLAVGGGPDTAHGDPRVQELLEMEGDAGRVGHLALLEAIRHSRDPRWVRVVSSLAGDDDPRVVEQAALTMAAVPDPRFIPTLLERLARRDGRAAIREAFVSLGDVGLDALVKALRSEESDPRLRLHIPRTISKFGTQEALDLLVDVLLGDTSGQIRYKALRGVCRMVQEHPLKVARERIESALNRDLVEHLRVMAISVALERSAVPSGAAGSARMLEGLLEDKLKQSLERAFRLLQVIYRHEDIRSVSLAVQTEDKQVRAHAQEFLDALTVGWRTSRGAANRALLAILADDLTPKERVARAGAYVSKAPRTYEDALAWLLDDNDDALVAVAGYHAMQLGMTDLRDKLTDAAQTNTMLAGLPMLAPAGGVP